MYDTYIVTTGCPENWTSAETIEEAEKVEEDYHDEYPHEDVTIFMNIGDIF